MGGEAEPGVPSIPRMARQRCPRPSRQAAGSKPCQPRQEQSAGRKREAPSIRRLHPHPRSSFQQEKIPEPATLSLRAQGKQNKARAQESWRAAPAGPARGDSRAGAGGCFGVSVPCSPQPG